VRYRRKFGREGKKSLQIAGSGNTVTLWRVKFDAVVIAQKRIVLVRAIYVAFGSCVQEFGD